MVSVVEVDSNRPDVFGEQKDFWGSIPWDVVIFFGLMALIVGIFLGVILWFAMWVIKKIKDQRKKQNNEEYKKYSSDLKMCLINADASLVKRPWYKLFIWRTRAPIYANTETGKRFIGQYLGEAVKKEGFYLIGIRQKYGLFKFEDDVVIFPYQLRKSMIKKNDDFSLTIECEGIDEVMSSEYYSIPVFRNHASDKEVKKIFTDFSNFIMKDYFQEYVYRDVIKENIMEFKEAIKDATEQNPFVQLDRKTGGQLSERSNK